MSDKERFENIEYDFEAYRELSESDEEWLIKRVRYLDEQLWAKERLEKATNVLIKEQSKKVKHLFPLENTAGYGQLCELVLKYEEALKQIAGISDISPLRESELMRDIARKVLDEEGCKNE